MKFLPSPSPGSIVRSSMPGCHPGDPGFKSRPGRHQVHHNVFNSNTHERIGATNINPIKKSDHILSEKPPVRRDQSHTPKRHRGERGSCHPPVKRNPNDEATRKTLLFDPIQHKSVLLSHEFSNKSPHAQPQTNAENRYKRPHLQDGGPGRDRTGDRRHVKAVSYH